MAIAWDDDVLRAFFGSLPDPPDGSELQLLAYDGPSLKYMFFLWPARQEISLSADHVMPFGRDSLYEFHIQCDRITAYQDIAYPGETGLAFWMGEAGIGEHMTMMMFKRGDGELKAWPTRLAGPRPPDRVPHG